MNSTVSIYCTKFHFYHCLTSSTMSSNFWCIPRHVHVIHSEQCSKLLKPDYKHSALNSTVCTTSIVTSLSETLQSAFFIQTAPCPVLKHLHGSFLYLLPGMQEAPLLRRTSRLHTSALSVPPNNIDSTDNYENSKVQ